MKKILVSIALIFALAGTVKFFFIVTHPKPPLPLANGGTGIVTSATETAPAKRIKDQPTDFGSLEARIHQLRVAEMKGALFKQTLVDLLTGYASIEANLWASKRAADKTAPTVDAESRLAIIEGQADFEKEMREVLDVIATRNKSQVIKFDAAGIPTWIDPANPPEPKK